MGEVLRAATREPGRNGRVRGAPAAGEAPDAAADGGPPLRILHVITSLARGGAQTHLLELVRGQKQRGHSVELAFFKDRDLFDDFVKLGVYPMPLQMDGTVSSALLGQVWGLVTSIKPDVLHTHLLKADAYGAVAGHFGGARVTIASKHNDEEALRRPLVARLHGWLSRWDDRVIVLSDHVGRYVVEVGRVRPEKIRRVYYGIHMNRPIALAESQVRDVRREFGLPPAGPFILTVGRLDPQKGHPDLFDAMRLVGARFPDARLVVVGGAQQASEAYVAYLREQAAEPDLAGKIVFAGQRTDVPRLMAACDVFALAPLWEGFGLVFAEAMAAGKPVVGTRVSAVPEVVLDGETGILVPPEDPEALAGAIIRLCDDPAERRRLGNNGYRRVREHFTADRMVDETIAVYREALADKERGRRA
jgi:glycosyltransferase involved in cell wall biosynthesis